MLFLNRRLNLGTGPTKVKATDMRREPRRDLVRKTIDVLKKYLGQHQKTDPSPKKAQER